MNGHVTRKESKGRKMTTLGMDDYAMVEPFLSDRFRIINIFLQQRSFKLLLMAVFVDLLRFLLQTRCYLSRHEFNKNRWRPFLNLFLLIIIIVLFSSFIRNGKQANSINYEIL